MKKALMIASILIVAVISTACINNIAVQELNNKAAEYMQKGDYEAAMSRLQASLDLDASMYQTYYNLGVAAINANKFDVAIDALGKGIKINPEFNDFYYSLGVAQIGKADELTEAAEPDDEGDADLVTGKAKLKREISRADRALAIDLKKDAIDNLRKYLRTANDDKNKADIEEMIKQSEEEIANFEEKKD